MGQSEIAAAASANPAAVNFGNVPLNNTLAAWSVTVTIDAGYRVLLASGTGINAPFHFDFDVCGAGGGFTGPGNCTVKETFTPTAAGAAAGVVNVFECPVAGGTCIAVPFSVAGTGVATVAANPASVDFGPIPVGATVNRTLTITVDTGYRISIASGSGINLPFHFDFDQCGAGGGFLGPGTCTVKEALTPTAAGSAAGTLNVFECPVAGGTCLPAVVALGGTGVAVPTFTVQPSNRRVRPGQSVSFNVAATGNLGPNDYQWQTSTDGGGSWTNLADAGIFSGTRTSTLSISSVAGVLTGSLYRCQANNLAGSAVSLAASLLVTNALPPGDFDGDGKSDISVFRPSTGIWNIRNIVTDQLDAYLWGLNGDIPVPGDYDGDGKSDVAVWRPSTGIWYVRTSSTPGSPSFLQWGVNGDIPVPGDYDGDGKTDVAVFRPSTGIWYVRDLVTNTARFFQWGVSGDIPAAADYDGDGKTDVAVWRPSTGIWYILNSGAPDNPSFLQWGLSGDIPVPGDYNGDGKADVAVFRPSTGIWYVRDLATNTPLFYQWGLNGDIPLTGDFDGDSKTDIAVYRPATNIWYVIRSSTGASAFYQWGVSGDIPVLKRP